MPKEVDRTMKLQITAGQATPEPPLGPALGQAGIPIGDFVNQFNEATKDMGDDLIPVEITIYEDRSFDFELKSPPASFLILKEMGIEKGAGDILNEDIGTLTREQAENVADRKMDDLNAHDMDAAVKIIFGTARSMGIETDE